MERAEGIFEVRDTRNIAELKPRPFLEERQELIQRFEADYVRRLLSMTRGNVSEAARKAGVSRQALYGLFKRHEIDPRQFSRSVN